MGQDPSASRLAKMTTNNLSDALSAPPYQVNPINVQNHSSDQISREAVSNSNKIGMGRQECERIETLKIAATPDTVSLRQSHVVGGIIQLEDQL